MARLGIPPVSASDSQSSLIRVWPIAAPLADLPQLYSALAGPGLPICFPPYLPVPSPKIEHRPTLLLLCCLRTFKKKTWAGWTEPTDCMHTGSTPCPPSRGKGAEGNPRGGGKAKEQGFGEGGTNPAATVHKFVYARGLRGRAKVCKMRGAHHRGGGRTATPEAGGGPSRKDLVRDCFWADPKPTFFPSVPLAAP